MSNESNESGSKDSEVRLQKKLMTVQSKYISSIFLSLSTFLESELSNKHEREEAHAVFSEFIAQKATLIDWTVTELSRFLATSAAHQTVSTSVRTALMQFVEKYPPHQTSVFLHEYLLALRDANCSSSTIKNYRSDINQFFSFVHESDINKVFTKPKVSFFITSQAQKGLKEASIRRKLVSITQFALWLQTEGIITSASEIQALSDSLEKLIEQSPQEKIVTPPATHFSSVPTSSVPTFTTAKHTVNTHQSAQATQDLRSRIKSNWATIQKRVRPEVHKPATTYLNLAIMVLFAVTLGFFGYRQFIADTKAPLAYPTSPTRPNRVLQFQGRLTDTSQNPITVATDMAFRLYDANTAGTLLWNSGTCSITPDQDGIFNADLGSLCGTEISENVFTENSNVWLEVQIESETLEPRQSIKTVPYALNSETIQGYPVDASGAATKNTVVTMNNNGEVIFGEVSPTLRAVSGNFAIEAETLTLRTSTGSNGNIVLAPDGIGITQIQSNLDVLGYVSAPGATLSATYAGGTALIARGGPGGTANIQEWQNNAGTALSIVNALGNIGIGTTAAPSPLTVGSTGAFTVNSSGAITSATGIVSSGNIDFSSLNTGGMVRAAAGTGRLELATAGTDYEVPLTFENGLTRSTNTIRLGGTLNQNTNIAQAGWDFTFAGSGNIGIGSASPGVKLDVVGNTQIAGTLNLTSALIANGDAGTLGYLLTSSAGGAMTWTDPASFAGVNYWRLNLGALSPVSDTLDLLIGSNATSSAKFAFMNVDSGIPTASISGNLAIAAPTGANPATTYSAFNGGTINFRTSVGGDTGATSRMFITNSGRIGIGTTNPALNLDVTGDIRGTTSVRTDLGGSFRFGGAQVMTVTGSGGTVNIAPHGSWTGLSLFTGGTSRVFIDAAGNVGIGTTTSTSLLTVGSSGAFTITSAGAISSATGIVSSGNIDFASLNAGGMVKATATTGRLEIATAGIDYEVPLTFENGLTRLTNTIRLGGALTQNTDIPLSGFDFTLSGTGSVGIGTTSTIGLLNVNGAAIGKALAILNETGDQDLLTASASGTTRFIVTNAGHVIADRFADISDTAYYIDPAATTIAGTFAGNVGIGTTNPSYKLHITPGIQDGGILLDADGLTSFSRVVGIKTNDDSAIRYGAGEGPYVPHFLITGDSYAFEPGRISFRYSNHVAFDFINGTSYEERVRFTADGNVGIGSAAPAYKLDLVGDFNLTGAIRVAGNAGTSGYILTSTGGGANAWVNPETINVSGYWELGSNLLYPKNPYTSVIDLALGGNSTASANIVLSSNGRAFFTNNVGIGTTNPTSRLHVVGSVNLDATTITLNDSNLSSAITLTDTDTGFDTGDTAIVDAINTAYAAATGSGGGGIWTDTTPGAGSGIIYPTFSTDDFAIGGTTLSNAAFSVNQSSNAIRFGRGSGSNATLSMYASNGSTGLIAYTIEDQWDFSGGDVDFNQAVAIGPNAGEPSSTAALTLANNYNLNSATYQLFSSATITSPTLTADAISYGSYFSLINNKTENIGSGFDSDGIASYSFVSTTGTNTFRNNFGAYNHARNTSTASSDLGTLYGTYGIADQGAASGTIPAAYGVYGVAQGATSASTSVITSAYGLYGQAAAYNSDIGTAYGAFNIAQTNDSYSGSITSAYGSYNQVYADSDDGGTITTGRAGYFLTNKRTGATAMTTAYGIEVDANGGATTYGAYISAADTVPTTNYGLYINAMNASANNYGIWGANGDWILAADGDGVAGGTGAGGDLFLGAGQDLALYHNGTNSFISNLTGDLYIQSASNNLILANSGGNVGVGTTSPGQKLDVAGNLQFSGALMPNGTAGTAGYILQSTGAGTAPTWVDASIASGNLWANTSNVYHPINQYAGVVDLVVGGTSTASANIRLSSNGSAVFNEQGNSSDFRIEASGKTHAFFLQGSSGNIGINTSAPSSTLHLHSTSTTNSGITLTGSTGTFRMYNNASIGTLEYWNANYFELIGGGNVVLKGINDRTNMQMPRGLRISPLATGGYPALEINGLASQTGSYIQLFNSSEQYLAQFVPVSGANQRTRFLLYNTLETTPTNFERLAQYADSTNNVFRIEAENGGTGVLRNLTLQGSGGNVGIGTTSPVTKLHVLGNARLQHPTGGSTNQLELVNGNGTHLILTDGHELSVRSTNNAASSLSFYTQGEKMRINSAGNVGIGTTSPSQKLDVAGEIELANYLYFGNGTSEYLRWDNSNFILSDDFLPSVDEGYNLGATNMRWAKLYVGGSSIHIGSNGDEGIIGYNTTDNYISLDGNGNGTPDMVVTAGGNTGIGTTNPANFKLQVAGSVGPTVTNTYSLGSSSLRWSNIYATDIIASGLWDADQDTGIQVEKNPDEDKIRFDTAGVERMIVDTTGNVGIGSTSPIGLLNVRGAATGKALVILDETGNQDLLTASASGTTRFTVTSAGYALADRFADISNTSYYIDPAAVSTSGTFAGNVGIGTTSPVSKLDIRVPSSGSLISAMGYGVNNTGIHAEVTGTAPGHVLFDMNRSGTTLIRLNTEGHSYFNPTNGNFGIGTTSPGSKLDVAGALRIRSDSSDATFTNPGDISLKNAGSTPQLTFHANTGGLHGYIQAASSNFWIWNQLNTAMRFATNATERMTILAGGNVGIGTTNPGALFHVQTTNSSGSGDYIGNLTDITRSASGAHTTFAYRVIARATHTSGTMGGIQANSTQTFITGNGGTTSFVESLTSGATVGTGATVGELSMIKVYSPSITGTVSDAVGLRLQNISGATNNYSIFSEGGNMYHAGNIGIGTITPIAALSIGSAPMSNLTNTATHLVVGGNSLSSTANSMVYPAEIRYQSSNSSRLQFAGLRNSAGSDWQTTSWRIQYAVDSSFTTFNTTRSYLELGNNNLKLGTNGTDRLTIISDGNVGIGSTSPGAALNVNGVIMAGNSSNITTPIALAAGDIIAGDTTGGFMFDASANDLYVRQSTANATGVHFLFQKSRGSAASPATIVTGDDIMLLRAYGYSTAGSFSESSRITMDSEGTIGSNIVPGLIRFHTQDAAGTLTQRMTINSTGLVTVTGSVDASVQFLGQSADGPTNPSFSWTSATTDGMFRAGTNLVAFTTAGVERMRISTTNVQIRGNSTNATFTSEGTLALKNNANTPFLSFHGNTGARHGYVQGSNTSFNIFSTVSGVMTFGTNSAERMRIDANGNMGIGTTTTTGGRLAVSGSVLINRTALTNGGLAFQVQGTSSFTTDGTGNYGSNATVFISETSGTAANLTSDKASIQFHNSNQSEARLGVFLRNSRYSFFMHNSQNLSDLIISGSYLTDSTIDIAERMKTSVELKAGEVACIDKNSDNDITTCTNETDTNAIGIITTNPGMVLGDGSIDNPNNEGTAIVALSGRVPVIVRVDASKKVEIGDRLSSDTMPKVAKVQNRAGTSIASAMETLDPLTRSCPLVSSYEAIAWPVDSGRNENKPCFTLPDGTVVGKVMAFVNTSYHDPDIYIADSGDIQIITDPNTQNFIVTNEDGSPLQRVGRFSDVVVANIRSGLVSTQRLIVKKSASIANLSVNSLTIQGMSLASYIQSVVGNQTASNGTQLISPIGNNTVITTATVSGEITFTNTNGQTVAAITEQGDFSATGTSSLGALLVGTNATVSGTLTTNSFAANTSKLGTLLVEGSATFDATVSANSVIANQVTATSSRIEQLEAKIAEVERLKVAAAEIETATVSGTLYANNIDGLENKIYTATAQQKSSLLNIITGTDSVQNIDDVIAVVDSFGLSATQSANLNLTLADLQLESNNIALTVDALFVNQYFKVNGGAFIAGSMGIGNSVFVEKTVAAGESVTVASALTIGDGYIEYTGNNTFEIQPSGTGSLSLMAGLMVLDENGTATINGNFTVEQNATVKGTLFANLLKSTELGNPLQVQVAGISDTNEVKKSRFEIIDELGAPVATISAEGKAAFAGGLSVGSEDLGTADLNNLDGANRPILQSNQTSGKATIPSGVAEVAIRSNKIGPKSLIYVTPVGSTNNKVLFVKSQQAENSAESQQGEFVVGFDEALDKEVHLNWWIIN